MDNATLLVYLLRVEDKSVCPVAKDEQAGVKGTLACCRHVVDVVDRLVDACVGIEVASELNTDRLAIADKVVALEIVGTIEAHVLKEVGQAALALLLLNGAYLLCDIEVRTVLRPVVVTDVIGESVVKLAYPYCRIDRQGRH